MLTFKHHFTNTYFVNWRIYIKAIKYLNKYFKYVIVFYVEIYMIIRYLIYSRDCHSDCLK